MTAMLAYPCDLCATPVTTTQERTVYDLHRRLPYRTCARCADTHTKQVQQPHRQDWAA